MEQLSSPTLFLFVMRVPLKGPRKGPLKSLPRNHLPAYLSWLENPVHTRSVIGSNPIAGTSTDRVRSILHGLFFCQIAAGEMIFGAEAAEIRLVTRIFLDFAFVTTYNIG